MDPTEKAFRLVLRQRERLRAKVDAELKDTRMRIRAEILGGRDGLLDTSRLRILKMIANSHVARMEQVLTAQFYNAVEETFNEQVRTATSLSEASLEGDRAPAQFLQAYQEAASANVLALGQELRARVARDLTGLVLREESVHRAAVGVFSPRTSISGVKPAFAALEPKYKSNARTAVSTAANAAHAAVYKAAGGEVEWRATMCTCQCVLCHQSLNGQRVPAGQPFHAHGMSFLHPPAHPNCRCYLVHHK